MQLAGKRAFVTGGRQGIGRGIVDAFQAENLSGLVRAGWLKAMLFGNLLQINRFTVSICILDCSLFLTS